MQKYTLLLFILFSNIISAQVSGGGCTNAAAINYNANATRDDGSCVLPIRGCTDPFATNYNQNANQNDGSCVYPVEVLGCTDRFATNYTANATRDDGTCIYSATGCTDNLAINYNPRATIDDGTCIIRIPGCMEPRATNYNPAANFSDGTCNFPPRGGCMDTSANNVDLWANYDDGSCTYDVKGCTDPIAMNYNANANIFVPGSCIYRIRGCMDINGINYNPLANTSNDSCYYPCNSFATPSADVTEICAGQAVRLIANGSIDSLERWVWRQGDYLGAIVTDSVVYPTSATTYFLQSVGGRCTTNLGRVSIITLSYTVHYQSIVICNGEVANVGHDRLIGQAGTYKDTTSRAIGNCDSITITSLLLQPHCGVDTIVDNLYNGQTNYICTTLDANMIHQGLTTTIIDSNNRNLGTFSVINDTCFRYIATSNSIGDDTVVINICDGNNICKSLILFIHIQELPSIIGCDTLPLNNVLNNSGWVAVIKSSILPNQILPCNDVSLSIPNIKLDKSYPSCYNFNGNDYAIGAAPSLDEILTFSFTNPIKKIKLIFDGFDYTPGLVSEALEISFDNVVHDLQYNEVVDVSNFLNSCAQYTPLVNYTITNGQLKGAGTTTLSMGGEIVIDKSTQPVQSISIRNLDLLSRDGWGCVFKLWVQYDLSCNFIETENVVEAPSTIPCGGIDTIATCFLGQAPRWALVTDPTTIIHTGQYLIQRPVTTTDYFVYFDTDTLTTRITVLPPDTAYNDAYICNKDSILLAGAYQAQQGTYEDIYTSRWGCDSVVYTTLYLLPIYTINTVVAICSNDSIWLQNQYRKVAGFYYDTLQTMNQCDSIIRTQLVIKNITIDNVIVNICAYDSVLLQQKYQHLQGFYYDTLTNTVGCDSIIISNLVVFDRTYNDTNISICNNSSYFVGKGLQTLSGIYYDTLTNAHGCDSVIRTVLTVLSVTYSDTAVSICAQESYFVGGNIQTFSGTYYDTLTNAVGCDSIRTTNLTVLLKSYVDTSIHICQGESYFIEGSSRFISSTYYDTLTNGVGCDSIRTTYLVVHPLDTTLLTVNICEGENYFVGGAMQTLAGNYYDTLINSIGCDSIITTNVVVNTPTQYTQNKTICEGQNYFIGGDLQTLSGIYYDTLTNAQGCDSVIITNLTIVSYPFLYIGVDTAICENKTHSIPIITNSTNPIMWQDGSTTPSYIVSNEGLYIASTNNQMCVTKDSMYLTIHLNPKDFLQDSLVWCYDNSDAIVVVNKQYTLYNWQDGTITNYYRPQQEGNLQLEVTDSNGCMGYDTVQIIDYCKPNLYIPTAFTPDGDGTNDIFIPITYVSSLYITNYDFEVFDRWGELIWQTTNWNEGWNGIIKTVFGDEGIYTWKITYTHQKRGKKYTESKTGKITLIR